MPSELHCLRPQWLLALPPLLMILIGLWRSRRGGTAWQGLVDAHLLPHLLVGAAGRPRRLPLLLLALAWSLGVVALAGPVWERLPQPVFATTAKRVILLDLSPSMNAADVVPSRLARARFEVMDLLAASREGQVALIAFGPEPYIVSPLTGDARTIADQVPRLGTDLLPVSGARRTGRALALAGELLAQVGAAGGEVILITDAVADASGPNAGPTAVAAARDLVTHGHRLSVLGVGTPEGAPVPGQDGGFVNDARGGIPMARLDRGALEALARAGQGHYVDLDPGDRDTSALIDARGAAMAAANRAELAEQAGLKADRWREEGPWLLLALLPVAALAFRRGWLLSVLALFLVLPPPPGLALGWDDLWQRSDQQGVQRLAAGEAAAAAALFRDPAWRAAARYRGSDYAGALDDLSGVSGAEADYNRANALARLGRLDEAIAAYERTLEQVPDHADARANLDLVRRLRDRQGQSEPPEQAGKDQSGRQGHQGEQDGRPSGSGRDAGGSDARPPGQESTGQQDRGQAGGADQASPRAADSGSNPSAGRGQQAQVPDQEAHAAQGSTAGSAPGKPAAPRAGDLGADALAGEPEVKLAAGAKSQGADAHEEAGMAADRPPVGAKPTEGGTQHRAGAADLDPRQREQQQAIEAQLRRVPDDPAGLLRQRFLLQQLRREGRLP